VSLNTGRFEQCSYCESEIEATIFPAAFRAMPPSSAGQTLTVDGESSCFYHSQKKAVIGCVYCGRFLCALCDVEMNGEHLCPRCIEEGKNKHRLKNLEKRRVLYDDVAMSLVIYPILFFYITVITAPIAIFIAIRHWNAPGSIVPRGKTKFVIAIILALAELSGTLFLFYAIFRTTPLFHGR